MLLSAQTIGTRPTQAIATFSPLPWQVAPWRDKSRVLLLTGSAGGGKSRLAAEKVHAFCLKYPGATCLMLRKAREYTSKSIIPFYSQSVVGNDPRVKLNKSDGVFSYYNGSTVFTGGMMGEEQREAVRSIGGEGGLDVALMEEGNAFTRQDYEEILGRLRHNAGGWRQLIIPTNPGPSLHWIKRDLINGGQAAVYYSGAKDNTHNPPDYLETLNQLTGMMRKRLVEGVWATAEGSVYDTFDPLVHICERSPEDFKAWYLCQDEGYTNPAVILLIGEDADGRWHVAREFYERGKLQADVVQVALAWTLEKNVLMDAVDAAAAGLIANLRQYGVPAQAAKGRVIDGIKLIQDRLAIQGDGRPRLTISPECINTRNEFESYVWKPEKDEPIKENDHALDALRYLAISGGRGVLFA